MDTGEDRADGADFRVAGGDEAIEEEARRWFLFAISEGFTEADAARLAGWRRASPRHERAYREAEQVWREADAFRDAFAAPSEQAASPAAHGSSASARGDPQAYRISTTSGISAGLLAACVALLAFLFADDARIWLLADQSTDRGEIAAVTLPDGSRVHLNTGSAIALDYSPAARKVSLLRGEAAFEVRKDAARPFSVDALDGRATALGTVFVVRAKSDAAVVTVSEGRVRVSVEHDGRERNAAVVLGEAQRTAYHAGGSPEPAATVDPDAIAPWRHDVILIESLPFAEAVAELNRYRPGKIIILADTSDLQPVTARFSIRDVEGAIDALAATHGLRVTRLTRYLTVVR